MNENEEMQAWHYFPSMVYSVKKLDFYESMNSLADKYLEETKKHRDLNEIYPVYMSLPFHLDPEAEQFCGFIKEISTRILIEQGYDMNHFTVQLHEAWVQEHYKHSGQEEHIHGMNCQISGFYFLEVPENSSRAIIHDPRSAKKYANLPEQDMNMATFASTMINFVPEPGQFLFTNSWLPHAFSKNESDKPFRFIHFNLGAYFDPTKLNQNEQVSPDYVFDTDSATVV